jgi:DivIVA domain-containing protein
MSPEPPLDATGIARRQFSTARKGFDPAEVRAFLHELADMVGRLQRGEAHERERAERAEERATLAEKLDQHRLVELLGEETARVLDAAREAAGDIRAKAEEAAARMVREAQVEARAISEQADHEAAARRTELLAEADALRREAEAEVERRRVEGQVLAADMRREAELERERMLADGERARAEAEAAAEQIRAAARDQGRRLVGEAQMVRERMLGDLSRRRRTAREQLERLNGARERLLAAYEVVKRTVDEATTELTVALPEARAASEQAMRRVTEEPEESVEVIEAELSVARMSGLVDEVAASAVSDDELDAMLRELAEEEAAQAAADAESQAGGPGHSQAESAGEPRAESTGEGHAPPTGPRATGPRPEAPPEPPAPGRDEGEDAASPPAPGRATAAEPAQSDVPAVARSGADDPGSGAGNGAPAPVSEGDKWGIRLPRSRPPAVATPAPARSEPPSAGPKTARPAPAGATATAATGDAAPAAGDTAADTAADEGETGPYVDELFARIRAEGSAPVTAPPDAAAKPTDRDDSGSVAVAERAAADVPASIANRTGRPGSADLPAGGSPGATAGAEADPGEREDDAPLDPPTRVLRQRDELLAPTERELGRRLKRVLADEQNEVLDQLRRGGTVDFADVVPPPDEHVDRYAIAAGAQLDQAAAQGAALSGGEVALSSDETAGTLGRALVDPLRVRIEQSFADSDGDLEELTERLRALYREWKANHIGNAVRHFTSMAYAQGAYEAVPDGAPLRWIVDRSCDACPDCDDNALAGEVVKGEAYPTGDRCAPAHPDCRCLVVASTVLD